MYCGATRQRIRLLICQLLFCFVFNLFNYSYTCYYTLLQYIPVVFCSYFLFLCAIFIALFEWWSQKRCLFFCNSHHKWLPRINIQPDSGMKCDAKPRPNCHHFDGLWMLNVESSTHLIQKLEVTFQVSNSPKR